MSAHDDDDDAPRPSQAEADADADAAGPDELRAEGALDLAHAARWDRIGKACRGWDHDGVRIADLFAEYFRSDAAILFRAAAEAEAAGTT